MSTSSRARARSSSLVGLVLILTGGCASKPKVETVRADRGAATKSPRRTADDGADRRGTATITTAGTDAVPSFGPVRFEFDSAVLSPESRSDLDRLADWLERNQASVTIEGHADEQGTTEYNLGLGQRRAQVIADYVAHLGIARARLATISYGEERPARPGDDDDAHAQNRRGELRPGR